MSCGKTSPYGRKLGNKYDHKLFISLMEDINYRSQQIILNWLCSTMFTASLKSWNRLHLSLKNAEISQDVLYL